MALVNAACGRNNSRKGKIFIKLGANLLISQRPAATSIIFIGMELDNIPTNCGQKKYSSKMTDKINGIHSQGNSIIALPKVA